MSKINYTTFNYASLNLDENFINFYKTNSDKDLTYT